MFFDKWIIFKETWKYFLTCWRAIVPLLQLDYRSLPCVWSKGSNYFYLVVNDEDLIVIKMCLSCLLTSGQQMLFFCKNLLKEQLTLLWFLFLLKFKSHCILLVLLCWKCLTIKVPVDCWHARQCFEPYPNYS